ncbi:MAG: hypothetical protein ACRDGN_08985 [bacterium]
MRLSRSLVTTFIPTALLLAWVAHATPTEAAFAGMLVGLPLTLIITLAAGVRAASTSGSTEQTSAAAPKGPGPAAVHARRAPVWPAMLAGTLATAAYWFRVWSYPGMEQWDLAGVPVLIFSIGAFWWPALFVAMSAWLLEQWLPVVRDALPYRRWLGAGVLAGLAGITLYGVGSSAYYQAYDRIPLEADVTRRVGHLAPASGPAAVSREPVGVSMPCEQMQAPPPPVVLEGRRITTSRSSPLPCVSPAPRSVRSAPSPRVSYRLEAGHLTIELDGQTLVQTTPYAALRSLEQVMESASGMLKRKDTARLTLVVRTQQRDILRFHAGEADLARPVWELANLDRNLLKNSGRLEPGSLAAMKETSVNAALQEFERRMGFQVAGDEVRITFTPPGPLNAATVGLYSSAWATANKALQEVVRYFPEIRRFHVDIVGFRTTVERSEVGKGFRLQHRLLRPDRILGIIVRRGDPKDHSPDPAFHLFDPKDGLQAAVVVFTGPLDAHIPGVLFEEMLLGPGLMYLLDVGADGTVTFLISDESRFEGPITLAAAGEKAVGGSVITNLGWLDATRFQRKPRK